MQEKFVCSECGAEVEREKLFEFDGKHLCESCLNEFTTVCDCCGNRIWECDAEGDANVTLCHHCYEYNYCECEECGRLIHNEDTYRIDDDDDYSYCYECYQKLSNTPIKSYNYKPEPIFYGSGDLYMGVELEIDEGGEYSENAEKLTDIANSYCERIYCKHDGSISEGFEIVSHPMTLDYHTNEMNWLDVLEKAVEMDYRSHNTSTCGLHVHVNRLTFGSTYEKQEEAIGRIVYFVEHHWNELVKFSRRTPGNLDRWAARYATISNTARETYKKAKDKRMGRYVAVNLENAYTVEFRLFRGTLRYETFIATLQLVDEICKYAVKCSDDDMEHLSWADFAANIQPNKYELIEYLKSKRLYVNEIQEESEEN